MVKGGRGVMYNKLFLPFDIQHIHPQSVLIHPREMPVCQYLA